MTSLAIRAPTHGTMSLRDRPGCGSVAVARTVRLGRYRRGAILQVTGLAGLALGLLSASAWRRSSPISSVPTQAGVELGTVLIFGVVGDAVGSILGTKLRRRAIGERFKKADALGGAAPSVGAPSSLRSGSWDQPRRGSVPSVARALQRSSVVRAVDAALPPSRPRGAARRRPRCDRVPGYLRRAAAASAAPVRQPTEGLAAEAARDARPRSC